MKVFKGSSDMRIREIPLKDALKAVREYNTEFCNGKSDAELVSAMRQGPIYTNFSRYWIK